TIGDDFARKLTDWRSARVERLKADNGWLTVSGLFWLVEGENTFGTAESNRIVLPPGTAPARAGSFFKSGDQVTVRADPAAGITCDGAPVTDMDLRNDQEENPQVL